MAEMLAGGDLGALGDHAARIDRERNDRAAEERMHNIWNLAVQYSRKQFYKKRLWKVVLNEARIREVIVKSDAMGKDHEALRNYSRSVTIARNEPAPFRYYVRHRLKFGAPAEWVEVVFDHVDPIDYNSPMAWQFKPDTKHQ